MANVVNCLTPISINGTMSDASYTLLWHTVWDLASWGTLPPSFFTLTKLAASAHCGLARLYRHSRGRYNFKQTVE